MIARHIRPLIGLFLLGAVAAIGQVNPLTAKEKTEAWTLLFNGNSLEGWTHEGSAKWDVQSGALRGAGGDGWLRSRDRFTDFNLKCDFKNSPKGNAGIFLRASRESKPGEPNPMTAYELQIHNEDAKYATGSIEDYIQRLTAVNPTPNQWHSYEVEVRGDHLAATLDGVKVLDGKDRAFSSGFIGLQHHKDMPVEYRNIKVKLVRR